MADRVMFIGWGTTVRGREERALESFNEAVGLYGRMQQDGRIESFDVVLLGANSVLNGCMLLNGTAAQIAALAEDEEFRRVVVDASMIVEDLNVMPGYANEGVGPQMALFAEAAAKVPQHA
jgi:hypothetical protein